MYALDLKKKKRLPIVPPLQSSVSKPIPPSDIIRNRGNYVLGNMLWKKKKDFGITCFIVV